MVTQDEITARQMGLKRVLNRRWRAVTLRTFDDYRRAAFWWELEALRGYASSAKSSKYAANMWRAAGLARLHGPGTWLELQAKQAEAA